MSSKYIHKVQGEIDRLIENGKIYWYDFNLTKDKMMEITNHFSKLYEVEVVQCKSCSPPRYDLTISL
jgi:hypothetical protein